MMNSIYGNICCSYCGSQGICVIPPNKEFARWDCVGCGSIIDKVDLQMHDLGYFHAGCALIPQFPNNRDYMDGFNTKTFKIKYTMSSYYE